VTASAAPLACLYLAFPAALEEEILDICHAAPDLPGITVHEASGYGAGARLQTVEEAVRGRSRRRVLVAVAPPAVLATLVESLRAALPTPDVAWWQVPVAAFGRLA
jgi:hypothetical protein